MVLVNLNIPEPKYKKLRPMCVLRLLSFRKLPDDIGWLKVTFSPGLVGIDVAHEIEEAMVLSIAGSASPLTTQHSFAIVAAGLLPVAGLSAARATINRGTIRGTVADSQGGVIPEVKVAVTNMATDIVLDDVYQ